MTTHAAVRIYNQPPSAEVLAASDEFQSIDIQHTLNSPSTCTLTLDANANAALCAALSLDCLIELVRWDTTSTPALAPYTEYVGFDRTTIRQTSDKDQRARASMSEGLIGLLKRREVWYPTNTVPLTSPLPQSPEYKTGDAAWVICQYVWDNCGPGAADPHAFTVNLGADGGIVSGSQPRLRPVAQPGLTVLMATPTPPYGTLAYPRPLIQWSGHSANKNVLNTIQDIAAGSLLYFDVVWLGGYNFEFRTYWPFRGQDKTRGNNQNNRAIIFTTDLQNIGTPKYTNSRLAEATVCLTTGAVAPGAAYGEVLDNIQTSTHATDSPYNDIETSTTLSQPTVTDLVQADNQLAVAGQARLVKAANEETIEFTLLPTPTCQYGRDFALGDLVTIEYEDITLNKQISGVHYHLEEGKEVIQLTFGNLFAC